MGVDEGRFLLDKFGARTLFLLLLFPFTRVQVRQRGDGSPVEKISDCGGRVDSEEH